MSIVIVAFITFKLMLLWRTSVFVPIEGLTNKVYENQTDLNYLWRNTLTPLILFILIALCRNFELHLKLIDYLNKRFNFQNTFPKFSFVYNIYKKCYDNKQLTDRKEILVSF